MTDTPTHQSAIDAALKQDWKEAIKINLALLKQKKDDTESLSRLAYAYLKTGSLTQAKQTYQKILTLDPYNQIAIKNSKKLGVLKKKDLIGSPTGQLSPMMFLEDPGKTKIAECIHMAPAQLLSTLTSGQEVFLKARNHCVEIRDAAGSYLAALPDDLSFRLLKLLDGGNRYQVVIKAVDKKALKIFIREISRGKRFVHQPSFNSLTSYIPFSRSESSDAPDTTPTGEDAEDAPAAETPAE